MVDSGTLPVPLEPLKEDIEERRLWVGNLDPRVTEFTLVKLLQTYGALEKFDMLFHRSGPLEGQPRGYAFVTYATKQVAETAKEQMNGMLVGNKKICVKWAHTVPKNDLDKHKTVPDILMLGGTKKNKKLSRMTAIKAIEAKLKVMESTTEISDFKITDKPSISQSPPLYDEPSQLNKSKNLSKYRTKPYFKTKEKKVKIPPMDTSFE